MKGGEARAKALSPPQASPDRQNNPKRQRNPAWDAISTSYVERQNLTVRMTNRRFTRLTNAFSKEVDNHKAMIALHYMHDNVARIHKTPDRNPRGPEAGKNRVGRGGSWLNFPLALRTTLRDSWAPDLRFSIVGFRCAKSL